MRKNSFYRFSGSSRRHFNILFASDEKRLSPTATIMGKAFPNPSEGQVTVPLLAVGDGYVNIAVYDLMGKRVKTLVDRPFEPGLHAVTWDGNDEQGNRVAQGVYLYKLSSKGMPVQFGRMVIR
jgi:flagellar hook assembly protein FlgD